MPVYKNVFILPQLTKFMEYFLLISFGNNFIDWIILCEYILKEEKKIFWWRGIVDLFHKNIFFAYKSGGDFLRYEFNKCLEWKNFPMSFWIWITHREPVTIWNTSCVHVPELFISTFNGDHHLEREEKVFESLTMAKNWKFRCSIPFPVAFCDVIPFCDPSGVAVNKK